MCKLSEITGKNVILLWEARSLGRLSRAFCDESGKRVLRYETDEGYAFSPLDVFSAQEDAIVLDKQSPCPEGEPCPLGLTVYSVTGKLLGAIDDLELKGEKITALKIGEETLDPSKLASRSDKLAILNDVKMRLVKREKAQEQTSPVPTLSGVSLPQKVRREEVARGRNGSYDFLLGKRLARSVTAASGEIIAPEGGEITREVIDLAEREGRLVQLALHSK